MRFLFSCFVLLVISLSSCQQRYAHVKKVKADKNPSVQKEQPKTQEPEETLAFSPADTVLETQSFVDKMPHTEPNMEAESVEPKLPQHIEKQKSIEEPISKETPKELNPERNEDKLGDEPLTSRERLLILSVFYVWFSLFSNIALIPAVIVLVVYFFSLISGLPLMAVSTIAILLGLSGILLVLSFIFSFIVGKRRIEKHLNSKFHWLDLIDDYFLSLLIKLVAQSIPVLFYYFALPVAIIIQFLPLVLFIMAIVYINSWK